MNQFVEAIVATADVARADSTIFSAAALREMHDGVRFVWDEEKRHLVFRCPASLVEDRTECPAIIWRKP